MAIIKNQSEQDYNEMEGVRSSILTIVDRQTLAHAKARLDDATESDKGALVIGSAAHDYILRPSIFYKKWGILPHDYDGRTTKGKELKAKLEGEFSGNIIKHDDHMLLSNLSKSLNQHPSITKLLNSITDTELSLTWEEDGIKCKARLDAVVKIGEQIILFDLKTSRSAAQRDFEGSCVSYGYLIQSAHYLRGAKANGIIDENNNNFIHVVIEKEAPFCCAAYCLDDASLELGDKRRKEAIRKFALASGSGIWPGYSEQIETIAAPHWFFEASSDFADGI